MVNAEARAYHRVSAVQNMLLRGVEKCKHCECDQDFIQTPIGWLTGSEAELLCAKNLFLQLPSRFKMGRPRLYHSPEEKAAANRAKSQKHYEKYV